MQRNNFSNFSNLIAGIEKQTSDALEGIAEILIGEKQDLRDGTEHDPVNLPRDLYAHDGAQTEWWYYTGHFETASGRQFGFEWVFFKRSTDLDQFGPVPLRLLGNPIYFAHFAITDIRNRKFRYAHRKSANGPFDFQAAASKSHYHLVLGDWSASERHGNHLLRGSIDPGISFDVSLKPVKEPILNGKEKDGVSFKDDGEASRYFSYTRMEAEGTISIDGETEQFTGSAWMDREFGTWTATKNQKGWDWFSIQLDDESELMCYQLRDDEDNVSDYSSGVFIDSDGSYDPLDNSQFSITPIGYWKSSRTNATYPMGWKVSVPSRQIEVTVKPVFEDQEIDSRGTTMIVYWEGACRVRGNKSEESVSGRAYVELVGYDRSHERPNLAYFLAGSDFVSGSDA